MFWQSFESAVHSYRDTLLGEPGEIAPYRGLGDAGCATSVRDAYQWPLPQECLDDLPAFPLVHVALPFARK